MRWLVIAEAEADQRIATALADRVLLDHYPEWLDSYTLDAMRSWCGIDPETTYTRWSRIPELAKRGGRRLHVHGKGAGADAAAARKVFAIVGQHAVDHEVDALLLIRDADNQPERASHIRNARDGIGTSLGFPIAVGVANPKREAWVLNGFDPKDPQEKRRLEEVITASGLDPRTHAHRLHGDIRRGSAERDTKRIVAILTASSWEHERLCWEEIPLETLRQRGIETGLVDYFNEVAEHLCPLFSKVNRGT
ncbi:hypothetical protein [Endothiovibrio diazotrophicus]